MKRFLLICATLVAVLSISSCLMGSEGKIYGEYVLDYGTTYLVNSTTLAGFPASAIEYDDYSITAGTYTVDYYVYYGYYYYPGNLSGTGSSTKNSYYWHSTYTVTANPGKLLTDGVDKYFTIYLSKYYGLQVSGDATGSTPSVTYSMSSSAQPQTPGTSTWTTTDGAYTVTVTNEIKQSDGEGTLFRAK